MWTLDTSVYVRAADPLDPDGQMCQHLLERLDATAAHILVPRLLLAELAGAIRRLTRDPIRARLALDSLHANPYLQFITLDDHLMDSAAEIAADLGLRGADAVYVAVARRHGSTLVSLDREQRERAGAIVPSRTPAEAIGELP